MPRVKGGATAKRRHKKVLKSAKGFTGANGKVYRRANEAVMKSLHYSYRDRRNKKRDFRRLWITRINAAARMNGMSYSRFIDGLQKAGVDINRKVLAELAVNDQEAFSELVKIARNSVDNA
ncbi:MAG: 50S ribosomal protein L20 [Firmicutes bacterium]|jgi:large subunit ribosomal protein L20|nr:50S ribosomal protein L20 [Bacillota bacterium]HXL04098.1 50S ribosomal protein L20 [Bacillota bacterium]